MYKSDEKRRAYKRKWNESNPERAGEYQRRFRDARRAWVYEQLGGRCIQCGSTQDLHVDHIDPQTKSFSFGQAWGKPIPELQKELGKCQLLCKLHHIQKTVEQHEYHPPSDHGTAQRYNAYKCRCEACRLWKRNYDREWRQRRKDQSPLPS